MRKNISVEKPGAKWKSYLHGRLGGDEEVTGRKGRRMGEGMRKNKKGEK